MATLSDRPIGPAVESYRREAAIVDLRLGQEITLQQKATALSDLCERIRSLTGIRLEAGPSVADEKVTVFCRRVPLRDLMRQLSRPFGYTWLRSGKPGDYRYELAQDLRSQLLEEELRNRDRREALLALESQIERFRPYLHLTPDEALARSRNAPPEEKPLLEKLASWGWGPIQMYQRLAPQDMAALRSGQPLVFSQGPGPGERPLPADVARGVLQAFRDWRVVRRDEELLFGPVEVVGAGGLPAAEVPEARARVTLTVEQSEPGSFVLGGLSGAYSVRERPRNFRSQIGMGSYAVGRSPSALKPRNGPAHRTLPADPALMSRTTVRPQPSCSCAPAGDAAGAPAPRATSADVLEAVHRATGLNVVGDSYTRLYLVDSVSVEKQPLLDTLDRLADTMRSRWIKDGKWLQFRSVSFYDDRLKEVPNRLLDRWAASRREHGYLTLDDLIEIAQLADAPLDAVEMAEGARVCHGLAEWDLARAEAARPHLRFLAGFTPEQRQQAMTPGGLPFARMSLAQQQQFLRFALEPDALPLRSLDELAGATLRVDYSQPGWFQWGDPGLYHSWAAWVVPVERGRDGRRVVRSPVRERTREATVQAVRRLDTHLRVAAIQSASPSIDPARSAEPVAAPEAQVFPTALRLTFVYIPGSSNARPIRISSGGMTNWQSSW